MQISHRVHTEMPEESAVWADPEGVGGGLSRPGPAEGKRDPRGAPADRSCAYVDLDPAEVFGGAGDGVHEGQDGDSHSSGLGGEKKELCGAAVLGEGLLGVDGGPRRRSGAPIHPRAREGRPTPGPTGANAALSG